MPLKHTTETFLLFLLASVTAITGLLAASLPPLPEGGIPWAILAFFAFLYPLALTPLFRERRADYPFRLLHWLPAVLLLIWFALQLLAWIFPSAAALSRLYTWGWTLPGVALSFALIIWFCLNVLRRREARMALLSLAFIPFVAGAIVSEQGGHWEREITALLWDAGPMEGLGSGSLVARMLDRQEDPNLAPSSDPREEAWRQRLRASEERSRSFSSSKLPGDGVLAGILTSEGTASSAPTLGQASSRPGRLPGAGGGLEAAALSLLALYCGVLHDRSRRRALA